MLDRVSILTITTLPSIDLKKTIILGIQQGTDRVDRLVFCVDRKQHFIITHDAGLNIIVDARAVTEDDQISENKMRRAVWLQSPEMHDEVYHPAAPGLRVKVFGQFWNERREITTKSLGIHPVESVPQNGQEVLDDEPLMQQLYLRASKHGLDWEYLHALVVHDQRGGFLMRVGIF